MDFEMNKIYNIDCLLGMDMMIKQCIQVDAIITDQPYGTTAVACKQTNRNFIGFELDANYFEIANKRLEAVQGSLF